KNHRTVVADGGQHLSIGAEGHTRNFVLVTAERLSNALSACHVPQNQPAGPVKNMTAHGSQNLAIGAERDAVDVVVVSVCEVGRPFPGRNIPQRYPTLPSPGRN